MNKVLTNVQNVQALLRTIDGTTHPAKFNFTIRADAVKLGFVPIENASSYPSIWIPAISGDPSYQEDQVTIVRPIGLEIFGYTKGADEQDAMEQALKLLSDMGTALYDDEFWCNDVYETGFSYNVAAMRQFGVVAIYLNGKFTEAKPV